MWLNTIKSMYLLVVVLLLAACGSNTPAPIPLEPTKTPTPLPVHTPTPLPTPTPTPLPTATPIPGYVGGEEPNTYLSFVEYYKNEVFDCYFDPADPASAIMETVVDEEYAGKAVYVGDGIWRFYVQIVSYDKTIPEETRGYKEEVIQVVSFFDRSWGNVCLSDWEEAQLQEAEYAKIQDSLETEYEAEYDAEMEELRASQLYDEHEHQEEPEYYPDFPEEDQEPPPDQEWP